MRLLFCSEISLFKSNIKSDKNKMNNNIDIYFFTDLKLDTKMSTNTVD